MPCRSFPSPSLDRAYSLADGVGNLGGSVCIDAPYDVDDPSARGTSQYGGPRQTHLLPNVDVRGFQDVSDRALLHQHAPPRPLMVGLYAVSAWHYWAAQVNLTHGSSSSARRRRLKHKVVGNDLLHRGGILGVFFCRSGVGRWRSSSRPSRSALCRPPLTPTSTSSSPA